METPKTEYVCPSTPNATLLTYVWTPATPSPIWKLAAVARSILAAKPADGDWGADQIPRLRTPNGSEQLLGLGQKDARRPPERSPQ